MRLLPTLFDRYVMRILGSATLVTAVSLTLIILLTQSIRYLELVISSDASMYYFLVMLGLAVPKFLEATLPLAFAIGSVYTAHRLMSDREVIIMTAAGNSVPSFGRGFLIFAVLMTGFQFLLSGWMAPISVAQLQQTRLDVKSHYATLLFREGVFNTLGNGLTVFVEQRSGLNELQNLMIHDDKGSLNEGQQTTILAKRGIVNMNNDSQQLLIYDGTQYQQDLTDQQISRLDFEQYTLDVPAQNTTITNRWQEPEERTLDKLFLSEETSSLRDLRKQTEFTAEINKRFSTPFLYGSYIMTIMVFMFLGQWNRRKQNAPLVKSAVAVIVIQALYLVMFNQSRDAVIMNIGLYMVVLLPIIYGIFQLRRYARIS